MFGSKIVFVMALTSLAMVQARITHIHRRSSTTTTTTSSTTPYPIVTDTTLCDSSPVDETPTTRPSVSPSDPAIVAAIAQANAAIETSREEAMIAVYDLLYKIDLALLDIDDDGLRALILPAVKKILGDLQLAVDDAVAPNGVVWSCVVNATDANPDHIASDFRSCVDDVAKKIKFYFGIVEMYRDFAFDLLDASYLDGEYMSCVQSSEIVEDAVVCINSVETRMIEQANGVETYVGELGHLVDYIMENLHSNLLKCNIAKTVGRCIVESLRL